MISIGVQCEHDAAGVSSKISGYRGIPEVLSLQFNFVYLLAWLGICVELDRYQ